jgi:predicted phage tail protein
MKAQTRNLWAPIIKAAKGKDWIDWGHVRATCDGLDSALQHARDLERQLAEAREDLRLVRLQRDEFKAEMIENAEQRDRLAEALESIRRSASTKMSHSWIQRQAEQALASIERKEVNP